MDEDLRTKLRALIAEIKRELQSPDLVIITELDRRYASGVRIGKQQVLAQVEALLGTAGYGQRGKGEDTSSR